jgi:hypothetical protein
MKGGKFRLMLADDGFAIYDAHCKHGNTNQARRRLGLSKGKRKLLPKHFGDLLKERDLAALKAVFDSCDLDARGGYLKQTALAFGNCPEGLTRWLVAQGADIEAADRNGETPLQSHSGHWQGEIAILLELGADARARDSQGETALHKAAIAGNPAAARLLLDHGALLDSRNKAGLTPLAAALKRCTNARIAGVAAIAELLLSADSRQASSENAPRSFWRALTDYLASPSTANIVTPEMQADVRRIGTEFEFHRAGFNPDFLPETSAAIERMYQLFDVDPVPRRIMHDGRSSIVAMSKNWEDQHQELWELLVPSNGASPTVQGEVIRISGRIHTELEDNGGVNWDADYKKMADAFLAHLGSGNPLPPLELEEAIGLVNEIKRRRGDPKRMGELATNWVARNPKPIALVRPDYER